MKVYLMRHGQAASAPNDAERPLTQRGRQDVAAVATQLKEHDCTVRTIWHSPLRRAVETAELLQSAWDSSILLKPNDDLCPDNDVAPMAQRIEALDTDVFVVGHLPHLPKLAMVLLGQAGPSHALSLLPAGVLVLRRGPSGFAWCPDAKGLGRRL